MGDFKDAVSIVKNFYGKEYGNYYKMQENLDKNPNYYACGTGIYKWQNGPDKDCNAYVFDIDYLAGEKRYFGRDFEEGCLRSGRNQNGNFEGIIVDDFIINDTDKNGKISDKDEVNRCGYDDEPITVAELLGKSIEELGNGYYKVVSKNGRESYYNRDGLQLKKEYVENKTQSFISAIINNLSAGFHNIQKIIFSTSCDKE